MHVFFLLLATEHDFYSSINKKIYNAQSMATRFNAPGLLISIAVLLNII